MADGKRYYWLKLKDDFFGSKRIKKLRNQAGGDTYTIIYLKMQLLAMKTDGVLTWTGLEDNFAEELALDLDEKPDDVEVTLMYLLKVGLAETQDNTHFFFPYAVENTGSEQASAKRVREFRNRERALQSNGEALQSNTDVTQVKRLCNGEIEIEKEIDIEIEKREKKEAGKPPRSPVFTPPTVDEVRAYCEERNNGIDAQAFVDFYSMKGWMVGKNKMKDWRAAVRTWEKRERETPPQQKPQKKRQYQTAAEYTAPKPTVSDDELWDRINAI